MSLNSKSFAVKAILTARKRLRSSNKIIIDNYSEVVSIISKIIQSDDAAS